MFLINYFLDSFVLVVSFFVSLFARFTLSRRVCLRYLLVLFGFLDSSLNLLTLHNSEKEEEAAPPAVVATLVVRRSIILSLLCLSV